MVFWSNLIRIYIYCHYYGYNIFSYSTLSNHMKVKYYNLQPWDQAKHGDELLTFVKIDGQYVQWRNENGEIRIGHAYEYEMKDGIYYPVTK